MHEQMGVEVEEDLRPPPIPEEIFEAELMPLFGGYSEYHNAPAEAIVKHKLRLAAQKEAEAEQANRPVGEQDNG